MINTNKILIAIYVGKDTTKYVYKNEFEILQKGSFKIKVQEVDNFGLNSYLKNDCSEEEMIERAITRALSKYNFSNTNKQDKNEEKNEEEYSVTKNLF